MMPIEKAEHESGLVGTRCSSCGTLAIVVWIVHDEALNGQFCESCLPRLTSKPLDSFQDSAIYLPRFFASEEWTKNDLHFGQLRKLVEASLNQDCSNSLEELIVCDKVTLDFLIRTLEEFVQQRLCPPLPTVKNDLSELRRLKNALKECEDALERTEQQLPEEEAKYRILPLGTKAFFDCRDRIKQLKNDQAELPGISYRLWTEIDQLEQEATVSPRVLEEMARKGMQEHVVKRLRRDFDARQHSPSGLNPAKIIHRLNWKLLKSDGSSWEHVIRHYEQLTHSQNSDPQRYELKRLEQIYGYKPDEVCIGLSSFEGYVAFVFSKANTTVLDCPLVGHALYMMDADQWKTLSQLSKNELLTHPRVQRLIHFGEWKSRLESQLKRRGIVVH